MLSNIPHSCRKTTVATNIAMVPRIDVCGGCDVISTKTASQLRRSTNSHFRFYSIILLCPWFSSILGNMLSNIPHSFRKTTVATIYRGYRGIMYAVGAK